MGCWDVGLLAVGLLGVSVGLLGGWVVGLLVLVCWVDGLLGC